MNVIDIILILILLYSAYQGFKNGLIVELCGILSIVVGFYLAYKLSDMLAVKLSLTGSVGYVVSFVIIVITSILTVVFSAKIVSKLLNMTGFGVINKVLGAVASLFKIALLLGVILTYLVAFNKESKFIEQKHIDSSKILPYVNNISSKVFPYFDSFETYYHKAKSSIEKENIKKDSIK